MRRGMLLLLGLAAATLRAEFTLSVIDDDSRSVAAIRAVKAIADAEGVKVTFAPVAANLERDPAIAAELRAYQAEGHEIGNHSYAHSPSLWQNPVADSTALEQDIEKADEIYRREQLKPVAFIYPYGRFRGAEYRRRVLELVGRRYQLAFNSRGDINLPGETAPLYISRHALRKHNSLFMEKRLIRQAAEREGWLVLLTHSANGDFSAERLRELIAYVKELGGVVRTVSQAAATRQWAQQTPESLPEFSRLDDVVEAVWMHLPLVLFAGVVAAAVLLALGWVLVRWRRKRHRS